MGYVRELENEPTDELIKEREKLMDLLTPNGVNWDKLIDLLEIERELTLREQR